MLQHFSSSEPSAAIFDALERDGGVIVDDFLSAGRINRLAADFAPHLDAAPW